MRIIKNKDIENCFYFYFNEDTPIEKTVEVSNGDVLIDYCKDGTIFGIETFCNKEKIKEIVENAEIHKIEESVIIALNEIIGEI